MQQHAAFAQHRAALHRGGAQQAAPAHRAPGVDIAVSYHRAAGRHRRPAFNDRGVGTVGIQRRLLLRRQALQKASALRRRLQRVDQPVALLQPDVLHPADHIAAVDVLRQALQLLVRQAPHVPLHAALVAPEHLAADALAQAARTGDDHALDVRQHRVSRQGHIPGEVDVVRLSVCSTARLLLRKNRCQPPVYLLTALFIGGHIGFPLLPTAQRLEHILPIDHRRLRMVVLPYPRHRLVGRQRPYKFLERHLFDVVRAAHLDAIGRKTGIDRVVPGQEHLIPHVEGAEDVPQRVLPVSPVHADVDVAQRVGILLRRHKALEAHRLIAEIVVGPLLHLRHVPVLLVVPVVAVAQRQHHADVLVPVLRQRVQQLQMVVERIGVVRHLDIDLAVGPGCPAAERLHGRESVFRKGIGRVEHLGLPAELLVVDLLVRLKDHAHIGHILPPVIVHKVDRPALRPALLLPPVIQVDAPDDPDGLPHILAEHQRDQHPLGAGHQPVPDDIVRRVEFLADGPELLAQRPLRLPGVAVLQQLSVVAAHLVAVEEAMLLLRKIVSDHARIGVHHPHAGQRYV